MSVKMTANGFRIRVYTNQNHTLDRDGGIPWNVWSL